MKYFEDFNNPNDLPTVDPSFLYPTAPDRLTAFTTYFNTVKGTNYTAAQVDSIYEASCHANNPINAILSEFELEQTIQDF